ncbi:MAG: glycosyltransferase family 4 protein [Endomicrobium sp.]|jgi:glycosyltransferase involved in cell wall biosynthesis|uniref:glycosyltransferase family 4 protein n=1 Tax=Candidatus Endomicrobiellum cubanum TaxID=3242325 RepID=UPI0028235480|nr:glycosyltransferase family 4 protein [Endomicrobium sp.]
MIKVCYIITKFDLGGAQKVALHIANNLNKKLFNISFIAGIGGILDKEVNKKLKVYGLKHLVREISPIKDLKALFSIYKILKIERPDIVHTHTPKAGILGRIAAKLAGVPTIIHTIHGYGFSDKHKWYLKCLFIYGERFCSLFSRKLIFVSKENIKKGFRYKIVKKNKFMLIRAGIDTNFYKNFIQSLDLRKTIGVNRNTKIVVTVASFKPPKNLKDFINVARIVTTNVKDVVFVIVGDGEQRKELESLIKKFNLNNKVILLGWRIDIADILKSSDIFVLTSLWEGLPCSILESMCCSKPVIANATDGVKEIVANNETGFLIEPNNYKQMAEKVEYLLLNENISKEMGKKGFNYVGEEYDINYALKQHENLYSRLNKK